MSFMYPRLIQITRPGEHASTAAGFQTHPAADLKSTETEVATGLPASIQLRREGTKDPTGLPGGGTAPFWDIFIPRRSLAVGSVKDRDIVTDDAAERYQVVANYWDSLGYRLRCQKLEA